MAEMRPSRTARVGPTRPFRVAVANVGYWIGKRLLARAGRHRGVVGNSHITIATRQGKVGHHLGNLSSPGCLVLSSIAIVGFADIFERSY